MSDSDIENLTLEQCKKIKQELSFSVEPTLSEKIIDENYFFMKSSHRAVISGQLRAKRNIGKLLDYMVENDVEDIDDFPKTMSAVNKKLNGAIQSAVLNRDILYFYNEAIPMEYKNNIFTYKRTHKKETEITDAVCNRIYFLKDRVKEAKQRRR